ncbi:MAG: DUF3857 domain-containing protein [Deinococcales bacterium]|nr:DUF3857 domain-containing protein [Chitinophagaceae bacterium]
MAQDYKASLIPDSLKTDANAVKRFEELHVIVKDIDKAIIKHKYAITILNENGEDYAYYENSYSKLHTLSDISGKLFDADGKLLKTIKKKDIADLSASDGDLISDARVKRFAFYQKNYPYTVEFEDEEELNGIYYLASWHPVANQQFAVQQSRFIVETPLDYQLRYKQLNYPSAKPQIETDKKIIYNWEVKNIKAITYEVLAPSAEEYVTSVFVAPTIFSIAGYKGNMSTWDGLGKFQLSLNKGRNELPDNIKQDIHKIADHLTTKEEKVTALYNYLQQNTRYISIQLGIGGWQPIEAKFVADKKFGDCKALSNYMVSILKEAGITANYVIVSAGTGNKGLWEDFPSRFFFNHVIACVPDTKDTLWLECTSQTTSAGYMGTFTGNRKALMITETGGVVVNTPTYTAETNKQLRKVTATIDEAGNLSADINTHFTGIQQELQHDLLHTATQEQRTKYLNNALSLPTYKVEKITYKETKNRIPAIDEYLSITSNSYASITGKRLFILPNLFNKESKLPTDKPRQYDIVYRSAYKDVDSIFIKIPDGYTLEAMPKDINIANKFGSYNMSYKVTGSNIELIRVYEQTANRFPAKDYDELVKFYDAMFKGDRARIVMVKKEG